MTMWRLANGPLRCGFCRTEIADGQKYLEYRIGGAARLLRCQSCGESMTGTPAPDVIEEGQTARSPDVRHQPSLGLEPVGAVADRSAWRRRLQR